MSKILTFKNDRASCVIGNFGTVKCTVKDKVVFNHHLDGFHIYVNASLGVFNSIENVYNIFSNTSPLHPGHDCSNCYQMYPILSKDIYLDVEDDGIAVGIGFTGYCDKITAKICIVIYNNLRELPVFDEIFDYEDGIEYENPEPKSSLRIPTSNNKLYDELYRMANWIG